MYKIRKPLYLICESPLHVGSGNDLGDIDLPIQREKHTGFPKVESSSLKGAMRQAYETKVEKENFSEQVKIHRIFGLDDTDLSPTQVTKLHDALRGEGGKDNTDYASAIGFTDARLLLFPVCSLKGIFAWITCPRVLKKFKHELTSICNPKETIPWNVPKENKTTNSCSLFTDQNETQIQLDEYLYNKINKDEDCTKLGNWLVENVFKKAPVFWKEKIVKDIVVLSDDDFKNFVTFSTEVITRIKINGEVGTVEKGGLFTEEFLPADSVLYSMTMFSNEFRANGGLDANAITNFFGKHFPKYFQLGGNATLGKGIVRPISELKIEDNEHQS